MQSGVPSKTQVDAAGTRLADALGAARSEPREAADVVDAWRQAHAEAMAWIERSISGRLATADIDCKVAQRLKRKPQIVRKLLRSRTMRLSQMQDIGGCRVLLSTPGDVSAARERLLSRAAPWYAVRSESDYRTDGRAATNYRALHLVVLRHDRHVEVQLRTRRQHGWAEAVERAAERTGYQLKDGDGPEPLVQYFRMASDLFWRLDNADPITRAQRRELRKLNTQIQGFLPDTPRSAGTVKLDPQTFASRSNNWLIIYNWREARFENWLDFGTDAEVAARRYGEFERRYPFEQGYEVVLIGADSSETISQTHAHYFGRTPNDIDPHGYFREIL